MDSDDAGNRTLFCPSAPAEIAGSVVFGVVGGSVAEPRVGYLVETVPVTQEVLAIASPVKPTEVFRFAAPCATNLCQHFDGAQCRLAQRVVNLLPTAVAGLPPCRIRSRCRWWQQEGKAACVRCPQIVTETHQVSELLLQVAGVTRVDGGTELKTDAM